MKKLNFRHFIVIFFTILLILILSAKTTWRVCSVCGVQEFERSLFGKTIEAFSAREVDEYGTYKKWKEEHDTLCNHQWVEVDEFGTNLPGKR